MKIARFRTLSGFLVMGALLLAALAPIKSQAADQLLLTLSLVEYSFPAGRTGTISLYSTATPSPFRTNPSLSIYDTGLRSITNWNSLGNCTSSFLAGGRQEGWLLGPETDINAIRTVHPTAVRAYGVFTGQFGDNSAASRLSCSGSSIVEQASLLYIFLLAKSSFVQGQGYHVGDVWYATDFSPGGNWYFLYSSTPL